MRYLGGKSRLAKKFALILLEALQPGKVLVEPFVGGFSVVPALRKAGWKGPAFCSDLHRGLPVLYRAIQDGWAPPSMVSKEEWIQTRDLNDWDDPLSAFLAFGCSFQGQEWQAYAKSTKDGEGDDISASVSRGLLKARPAMHKVTFRHLPYHLSCLETVPTGQRVVYADPPYLGTTGYHGCPGFQHHPFYEWCEAQVRAGSQVLVSEFTVPDRKGWDVVWAEERKVMTSKDKVAVDYLIEVTA